MMLEPVAGVPSAAVAEIKSRLSALRRQHAVAIPLAVESGSRAWGFPSPDSDFDCRFVFVRDEDSYLSPWSRRDVIELPIEGDYDINGWELGKALKLMLKGNAVILEWLQSPFSYEVDEAFRHAFLELARRYADRKSIGLHYLHLGQGQWRTYFSDGQEEVAIKKVFYALRPAAALRWLVRHADQAIPPMNFVALMEQCAPPPEVRSYVADLLQRKAVTRELGKAVMPAALAEFITGEFASAQAWLTALRKPATPDAHEEVEAFFRTVVRRLSPTID